MSSEEGSKFVVGNEEVEEFEVTEIDEALFWDLLEELKNEEESAGDGVGYVVQSPEVGNESYTTMDSRDCFEQHAPYICDFNWLDTMEMATPLPSDEMMIWYSEACVEEMVGMVAYGCGGGDCSQFLSGDNTDETAYTGLWED